MITKTDFHTGYDIAIIGGGIAGLTAARELSGRGLKLAVVEAKERLGGRTWFQQWQGWPLEMGGGWVYWTQPHVWAEITRYNLPLFERPGWPKAYDAPIYALIDGEVVANSMAGNMGQLFPLVQEMASMAHQLFPRPFDPHSSMEQIAQYDHLSSEAQLSEMDVTPLQRVLLNRLLATQCHNQARHGGFVEFLRWYALSHFNMEVYLSTASRYQFVGGTQALVDGLWGDSDADLYLNTPVATVEQNDTTVTITATDGQVISAKYAILATPINVLNHIDFSPPLNEAKQALSTEKHSGAGQKIYVRIAGHWPNLNCAADDNAPITTVIVQEATENETLLVIFTVNDLLKPVTKASIEAGLRLFVPEIEVLDFTHHDWVADPYAQGTWCSYRPQQTSLYLKLAQQPEGRLHFAGADLANGWRGFIDGAIESGLRAANNVENLMII